MDYKEIDKRYSSLAESSRCLSCGEAIYYSGASMGEICVDLGSGRGTEVSRLAKGAGNSGFIYGIDISEGMLQKTGSDSVKIIEESMSYEKGKIMVASRTIAGTKHSGKYNCGQMN
jgi:arsenite methyltransferase